MGQKAKKKDSCGFNEDALKKRHLPVKSDVRRDIYGCLKIKYLSGEHLRASGLRLVVLIRRFIMETVGTYEAKTHLPK
jgi:hypothetical protein